MADRQVTIGVIIGGRQSQDGQVSEPDLTISFSQIETEPNTLSAVVNPQTGGVNLANLPSDSNYFGEVDLYFIISGSVLGLDGNSYPVGWANAGEQGNGFCWLVNSATDPTVKPWPAGMSASITPGGNVFLDDNLPDGNDYYYCLGFVVLGITGPGSRYYITIDPKIVNPGGIQAPPAPERPAKY
jgi:hypothetical protein